MARISPEDFLKLSPKVGCRKCGDWIRSTYPGEFVSCKCKAIYCDQTEWYSRYGGDPKDFIYPEELIDNDSSE